jgi:hypothetical protein
LAIAGDTPVPILGGWKLASQLNKNDYVFSWDGYPVPIKLIQQYTPKEMYLVQLKDGIYVEVDRHTKFPAFTTFDRERESRHKTNRKRFYTQRYYTAEEIISNGLLNNRGVREFSIENAKPLQFPSEDHPVPPFIVGLWAAKRGAKERFKFDADWIDYVQKKIRSFGWHTDRLKNNTLQFKQSINTTFLTRYMTIPAKLPVEYTFGSVSQRIDFLRGIVAMKPGCYDALHDRFHLYSRSMKFLTVLQGVCESLGMKTQLFENKRRVPTHRLTFRTNIKLHLKQETKSHIKGSLRRMIMKVEKIQSVPAVHIETDVPFVVGAGFLPIWR